MIYMILFHNLILRACQLYLKCLKNLQFFFIYILYADDTVLVAESAQQFQNQLLNHFENYRKKWNLNFEDGWIRRLNEDR